MNSNIVYSTQADVITGTESSNQVLSTGSQIMLTVPMVQNLTPVIGLSGMIGNMPFSPALSDPDLTHARTPGLARGRILRMADDFDASL